MNKVNQVLCITLIGVLYICTLGCGGSNSPIEETGYYVEDVDGNTLVMSTGIKVRLLGIEENSSLAENFIRDRVLDTYVDLVPDSQTGDPIYTTEDEVYRYVIIPSDREDYPYECLNTLLIKEFGMRVWDASYVVDSLDNYNSILMTANRR